MTCDLFADEMPRRWTENLAPGAAILHGYVWEQAQTLITLIDEITHASPFRHMVTPGGYTMSVAMTNCGPRGWVTDEHGYRYVAEDPLTAQPWPEMPALFFQLATFAAQAAGFPDFFPDACLINRYDVGSRLSLHQDKDEQDFSQPIVSFSLGLAATFLFGGIKRNDPVHRLLLGHGDVVVWGGASRLYYHAVQSLKNGPLPAGMPGAYRFNLTFRKAG
ncbi:DNA oxidative demethylase AlkB [Prodigiosinella aquatilis]|nr:DNA oxidative demethylase AlkB [Prodigiosinella sp. LS101]WJV55996.1 DNA oxidative demethylase AlkB [Prodigiosinella sp. LS101]WJV60363.1 DNA oxidative demethylase AlkB [Pectobacteriaceae bacterium C111]